jgi:hypothetical protein
MGGTEKIQGFLDFARNDVLLKVRQVRNEVGEKEDCSSPTRVG